MAPVNGTIEDLPPQPALQYLSEGLCTVEEDYEYTP